MYAVIIDLVCIVINLVGLFICLIQYLKKTNKLWVYMTGFLLGNLLSNYYWGAYELVMGDYPNVSSMFANFGWNVAYLILVITLISMRRNLGVKGISPITFLLVPINFFQLLIYLQYGGYFNNIWQVSLSTIAAMLALDAVIVCIKKRKDGLRPPYICIAMLGYILVEYIMWTSSCYDWPSEWLYPYNYAAPASTLFFVLIPLAIKKQVAGDDSEILDKENRLKKLIGPVYISVVIICCTGGFFLAFWMRNVLRKSVDQISDVDPYSVIAVMLFVISLVIVMFTVTVIMVFSSEKRYLLGERLQKEKDVAERSNLAKSEFLANMSHEIRTPINAVLGMNEMILRESLKARDMLPELRSEIQKVFADICNYAGNIESAGNNLLSIINDILDFSKIEAGKLEIVEGEYKLSSVLNDVSNMIAFKAENKQLSFIVDVDKNMPDVLFGDEVRVRQILTNLLNNAVKYTQKGSVLLSVRVGTKEDDNGEKVSYLSAMIKDTGIGIREEDIDKLFSKFERVDLEKNSTIEGTGLGLAITKSLITLMNGDIEVESVYGEGSTFTVFIPQKIISDEPIGDFKEKFEKSIRALNAQRESFHAPDAHILIVDDTVMNLTVAKGLLKDTEICIDTASGGQEAVDMASKTKYDLIFMDQRMPGMDGVTAMHHIKDDVAGPNASTPVVCLTADAVTGAREKYMSEGFAGYLTKPIDIFDLEMMLRELLPKDKIVEVKKEVVTDAAIPDNQPVRLINKADAMKYCGGSEEFYQSLLGEFVREFKSKQPDVERYFEDKNWNDYGVLVHAIKSTAKMIGASELSELARGLEKAADNGFDSYIKTRHPVMMEMYKKVIDEIESGADYLMSDTKDDDIMDFYPVNNDNQGV